MANSNQSYPARLDIEYPGELDRFSTFFRLLFAIPILIVLGLLTGGTEGYMNDTSHSFWASAGSIGGGLFIATVLMLLFQQRYPRWWFNFVLELTRFSTRVSAYLSLLTDRYPSTEDKQSVSLDLDYPDAKRDLSRWLPLVKWLLAIPHYIVLFVLFIAAIAAVIIAWFAILFTGKYPRELFDFVVGVTRWQLRVSAFAFLLITDEYPPFSLK